jgi:hypothetical protein
MMEGWRLQLGGMVVPGQLTSIYSKSLDSEDEDGAETLKLESCYR